MDGRTMVPLRFVSENCGYKVKWHSETQRIDIAAPSLSTNKSATTLITPVAIEITFSSKSGVKIVATDGTWRVDNSNDSDENDIILINDNSNDRFSILLLDFNQYFVQVEAVLKKIQEIFKLIGKNKIIK